MQTELEKRLSELAASFRAASGLRLADATQRTVRENVALRRQLETLLRHCRQLDARRQDSQENERELRLVASLHEAEARLALGKVMRLHRRTERLALEQQAKSQAIGRSLRADKYARLSEAARRESSLERHEELRKSRLLEQNIQKSREDRLGLCREAQQACQRIARLAHILERAKRTVQQALAKVPSPSACTRTSLDRPSSCSLRFSPFFSQTELRQPTDRHEQYEQDQEDACSDCLSDYKEHLLHSLANIFDEYSDDTDREPKELLELVQMDNSRKEASNVPAEEEDDPDMDYWSTTPNLHQAMYESQILDQQHRIERFFGVLTDNIRIVRILQWDVNVLKLHSKMMPQIILITEINCVVHFYLFIKTSTMSDDDRDIDIESDYSEPFEVHHQGRVHFFRTSMVTNATSAKTIRLSVLCSLTKTHVSAELYV
ncbi:unnamed protein product [Trichogramma brassicae]|uniref:Cilia- and flagella-associated protein 157 n=2 Tax=Apocrita TaxID=7400 RepID=A0A6H5INW0_9HYME|nr:unnamed protein product [Trichogramma brassicae]